MVVSPAASHQLALATAVRPDQPDLEVAVAVAGEGDPLPRGRPVAHGVGPLPLRQAAQAGAVGAGQVEVLGGAVPAGAEDQPLAVGREGGKAVVALHDD